jgi:gliding-associated putative ABC transporter substrate-binding component GldG
MRKQHISQAILQAIIVLAILIVINVLAQFFYTHLDLTEDKRFTLSDSTVDLVDDIDDNILVQVFLDGELAAGFKRLKNSTNDLLRELEDLNSNIQYEFIDPSEGSISEVNTQREALKNMGITPTSIRIEDGKETVEKYIYPYAIVKFSNRTSIVSLLEQQQLGVPNELILNNSVSLLEYKFTDAFYKVWNKDKPNIVFTAGHGELDISQTASLEGILKQHYDTGRLNIDSLFQISPEVDVLIVAKPKIAISPRSQFIIDQYIMNGGKVIWLIDQYEVNLDSIARNQFYVPREYGLNLDDMFFNYGVRFKDNLILDLESSKIPQVVGQQGDKPQLELFNWFYHPLIASSSAHPIVKNIDRINMFFPSTLDTVKTKTPLKKTFLLKSSPYTRFQGYPMRLNFEILRYQPDPNKFDKGPQEVALLVEGKFESLYKNRVSENMRSTLAEIDADFVEQSPNTKQLFVTDGDFIKNLYNPDRNQISPMGYNKWEEKVYKGNQDFIINAIDYMVDDYGLLDSRSKEVKLRLLNTIKASEDNLFYRLLNIGLPLFLLLVFGLSFNYLRKRKYSK